MARFTLSIELVDASEKDYSILHSELRKKMFKETSEPGLSSARPEYTREGNISIQDVVLFVARASAKTGKEYSYTIISDKSVKMGS